MHLIVTTRRPHVSRVQVARPYFFLLSIITNDSFAYRLYRRQDKATFKNEGHHEDGILRDIVTLTA